MLPKENKIIKICTVTILLIICNEVQKQAKFN